MDNTIKMKKTVSQTHGIPCFSWRGTIPTLASMAAAGGMLLLASSAMGADKAWNTNPANANFSGNNWLAGQVPGAGTATLATGDAAYFGSSSKTNLNNDTSFILSSLVFNSG